MSFYNEFDRFKNNDNEADEYDRFITDNQDWLPDYALFMAVKLIVIL